ncbi:hypothetical protein FOA43_002766 [Brettanomyces nanus]|uniref:J domain-containing protein n=1 Tax=Eeniella nana TaxID=13502 RepID=A0A875S5X3_EENNA|nr:uncharacterized protein FOA43_002766 [Brettanomyces nanus]QPG75412.1 hypothetical protein FOA43_002766 [Brettanomyces nanus]
MTVPLATKMPDYSLEQKQEVERIMSIEATDYYTILKVEKAATETQIKKSYRKLAMKLHPDKNKHPQSSDAFKKIAKAFEVLGDDKKRNFYDQTGADPDSRGGGGGGSAGAGADMANGGFGGGRASPFGNGSQFFYTGTPFGGARGGAGGGMFEEDLFDMLFGGNNGFSFGFDGSGLRRTTGFGNGNSFFRTNNGPGMRRRPADASRRRGGRGTGEGGAHGNGTRPADHEAPSLRSVLYQYLPLLLVLVPMLFNVIVDSFNSGSGLFDRTPSFSFETSPAYSVERTSENFGVKYYITADSNREMSKRDDHGKTANRLNSKAEEIYVRDLRTKCRREQGIKERMIEDSYGFFFPDKEKLEKAKNYETRSCDRLKELQLS